MTAVADHLPRLKGDPAGGCPDASREASGQCHAARVANFTPP